MTTAEYGLSKAARSFNSRLDKSKLVEAGFTPLPTWQHTRLRNKIFRKYKASGYAGVEAIFERDQRNQKFIWGMYDRICRMFCRKTR